MRRELRLRALQRLLALHQQSASVCARCFLGTPLDPDGRNVDSVEYHWQRRVKATHAVPDRHDPFKVELLCETHFDVWVKQRGGQGLEIPRGVGHITTDEIEIEDACAALLVRAVRSARLGRRRPGSPVSRR